MTQGAAEGGAVSSCLRAKAPADRHQWEDALEGEGRVLLRTPPSRPASPWGQDRAAGEASSLADFPSRSEPEGCRASPSCLGLSWSLHAGPAVGCLPWGPPPGAWPVTAPRYPLPTTLEQGGSQQSTFVSDRDSAPLSPAGASLLRPRLPVSEPLVPGFGRRG